MRVALGLVLTVGFLQPAGCRSRPLPAGFPGEYLEMLQSMAGRVHETAYVHLVDPSGWNAFKLFWPEPT